jgi:uncharacterized protein
MLGLLGLLGWPVTVVSSNFISLLLILNLALVVHLIVRFRELHDLHPDAGQRRWCGTPCTASSRPACTRR